MKHELYFENFYHFTTLGGSWLLTFISKGDKTICMTHSQYCWCWWRHDASGAGQQKPWYWLSLPEYQEGYYNSSPLVPHICVSELDQHWFRLWLVACSAPSHYLNQNWLMVNYSSGNKFRWNSNWNSRIFINENAFEIVVCQNGGHFFPGKDE